MGIESLFIFAKDELISHWVFLLTSIFLGTIGNVFKKSVWTKERAASSKFFWWMRATMPLHPVVAGAALGLLFIFLFKENRPSGPGIDTEVEYVFYFTGSGVLSTWIYSGIKHFLKSKGMVLESDQE